MYVKLKFKSSKFYYERLENLFSFKRTFCFIQKSYNLKNLLLFVLGTYLTLIFLLLYCEIHHGFTEQKKVYSFAQKNYVNEDDKKGIIISINFIQQNIFLIRFCCCYFFPFSFAICQK